MIKEILKNDRITYIQGKSNTFVTFTLSLFSVFFLRGLHHWVPRTQRLFGGQIIGQALVAAAKSVSDNLFAHSLHCYFVRAGKMKRHLKVLVRDGDSRIIKRGAHSSHK